jgi:hypothetical protein
MTEGVLPCAERVGYRGHLTWANGHTPSVMYTPSDYPIAPVVSLANHEYQYHSNREPLMTIENRACSISAALRHITILIRKISK